MFLRTCTLNENSLIKSLVFTRINHYCKLSRMSTEEKPVENSIKKKLVSEFDPVHLQIINESYMHNVPKGSESHFKVVCVSKKFENMPLVQRHRVVYSALTEELKSGVHALSITAKPPSEWSGDLTIEPSPKCLGGFGK